ncbi:serine/threonine protein kinase [Nocardiopsis exhalans]|uniref:non-specific serine/threonine protein kinase n=1 Tax=Nocardiopsis exhalans TaxID=163604 RepID=A0ABY5DDG4_9ACTN|nr:serine/threonine-protein kinase [Nocardiopsis exhalans]USY21975.1 serine/threonine protein kinase [Nocardiopsis exhalans]
MVPTDPPDPSGPTQNLSEHGPRRSVGRYELLSELGSGAMGTVWRAHDTGLNRVVAIKEVHLPYDMPPRERERARARVVREAQAAARIAHPSVVTVHDVLEEDGVPYIVMELLDGESLSDRLKRSGPMSEAEVERIARPLLGALWAAHRAGVIHRDVKPANIMLTEDGARPVLTDFGIANLPDHGGTALTGTGTILGTAAYAAPERLENDETSAVSDLWSLGATLFAALDGESPFKRDTLTSTLTAVLTQPVPPVPAGGRLASVVGRLLERDPRRRLLPKQALTVLDAPEAEPHRSDSGPNHPVGANTAAAAASFVSPPAATAAPVSPSAPAPRRSRAPLWIGGAAVLALLVLVGLTLRAVLPGSEGAEVAADGVPAAQEPSPTPSPSPSEEPTAETTEPVTDDTPEGFVHHDDGVVEFVLPEDWEVRDGDAGGGGSSAVRLTSLELETGVETGTATVVVTEYDLLVYDAEGAMRRMQTLLEEDDSYSDVEQQRLEPVRVPPGMEGAVYEVLFHHEEREVPGRWMFSKSITDEDRRLSYRLSFNFPAELREEYQDDFQTMIDSFSPGPGDG